MLPLFAQRATTSPDPPDSLKVPMNTRSNATFGEDVMPLKSVCARSGVSHCTVPTNAFRRTTVPFDVPTMTELSNTAGDEKPRAEGTIQTVLPPCTSRPKRPCMVVMNIFPNATAGVAPITRAPVSRSQLSWMASGAGELDAPLFARSPRNSIEGSGSSTVGTGGRILNQCESNPRLDKPRPAPPETTRPQMPAEVGAHHWPLPIPF